MGNLQQRFGRLVAARRRTRGWAQRQLAEATELSDDMIAKIEVGSTGVSFTTIEKLAAALEVDPAELFTAELPDGALQRGPAAMLMAKILQLRKDDLLWLENVVEAVLQPKP